jgi:hypothetical protein
MNNLVVDDSGQACCVHVCGNACMHVCVGGRVCLFVHTWEGDVPLCAW